MHAVMAARDLVGHRRRAGGGRIGVRHLEHRRHAAHHRAARTLSRSSLWVRPGSRKCTWVSITPGRICSPRQSIVSPTPCLAEIADRGNAAASDAEIAHGFAIVIDDRAALEDQVVALRHSRRRLVSPQREPYVTSALRLSLTFPGNIWQVPRMKAALLTDRGVVKVAGDDAGEIPQRARDRRHRRKVTPAQPAFAALLTPQGKIIVDFIVAAAEPGRRRRLFSRLPARAGADARRAAQLLQAARQGHRSTDLSESLGVLAIWDGAATPKPASAIPIRACRRSARAACCRRTLLRKRRPTWAHSLSPPTTTRRTASRSACRAAGLDFIYGDAFPHETDMDQLQRRRFRERLLRRPGGRLAHGASRHRPHARRAGRLSTVPPPEAGLAVMAGEKNVGMMGSGANGRGLAMLAARSRRRCAGKWDAVGGGRHRDCVRSSRTGRGSRGQARRRRRNERNASSIPTACAAAPGRSRIRSTSPITTMNGACRNMTTARSTRSSCSTASRPGCRGSRSCASARISAPPSTTSRPRRSRVTRRRRSSG